jgi:hypothetical protein
MLSEEPEKLVMVIQWDFEMKSGEKLVWANQSHFITPGTNCCPHWHET